MRIKGINLGGWLLMEGYILGGRNIPESSFKKAFKNIYGDKELKRFERLFRDNFIREDDFKNIALMGANAVRVPFHYRLIENKPFSYSQEGFHYLDKVLSWAKDYKLGVILDLHAAPGAQNCDWHSDSQGKALLWEKDNYRERTLSLWEAVADRFKGNPALLAYDILNEPVLGKKNTDILKKFYQKALRRIRAVDRVRTIFLEGDLWSQRIDFLKDLIEDNVGVSIHTYQPLNYTFNFTPFYRFPGRIDNTLWDKKRVYKYLEPYFRFSKQCDVEIFVGEFGINWRGGCWGETEWLKDILEVFEEFGFSYTYWTYKAVANSVFPDGLYQFIPDCKYISRQGPVYGWESYLNIWEKDKKEIVDFWHTKRYTSNKNLIAILEKFFNRPAEISGF